MKRIGLLTDIWGSEGAVRTALREIESNDIFVETIEEFGQIESVAQGVWALINLVDIVIAQATSESSNIYYEIGLAHGLGKPVILVAHTDSKLPQDLLGQRIIFVDDKEALPENLAFRIREAITEIEKANQKISGFSGPRERLEERPKSVYPGNSPAEFRALFAYEGGARAVRFEKWFADIARHVSGWEVIESEKSNRDPDAFDLVIWNSREDLELIALGNPIAVELKSVRSMNSDMVRRLMHRTKISGLRSVVLATTGVNNRQSKRLIKRLGKEESISVITLDRDDLIKVTDPDAMAYLFKEKVRELLYKEGL